MSTRHAFLRSLAAAPAFALVLLVAGSAHAITATKASDICSDVTDPCVVTSVIDIPVGVCTDNPLATCSTNADCAMPATCDRSPKILDFGTRDVQVSGGGQFNFGAASGSILAGDFTANTTNPAIDAAGIVSGGTDSGTVRLYSRRKCNSGTAPPPCVSDSECDLNTCDTRCTLRRTEVCSGNADCLKGTCVQVGTKKRCSGNNDIPCTTDANCNFGTCPTQTTCSKVVTTARNCSTNTDCLFGQCTVGTASIIMNGPVVGNSESPAFLDFRAADNVTISKPVNLAGTTAESDGGELYVDATFGTATVTGKVTATSGGFGFGGDVSVYAGTDVLISEEVDVSGGDSGGGFVDFDAERDLTVQRSVFANSSAGAGDGGEILFAAGRDFSLTGISAANKTSLETTGHTDITNFAGDGGTQDITAERNLTLNVNTRMISNGPVPDASAGDLTIDAGEAVSLNGDITARATGAAGTGGYLDVASNNTINVSATGTIDLTGGSGDAGDLQLFSTGDLTFGGLADLSASNGGGNGAVAFFSSRNATVSGTARITTGDGGDIDVSACYVTLTSTGKLDQGLTDGRNTIEADEQIRLNTGSLMKTGPAGQNVIEYRTAAKPPIINGTVSPAPQLVLDSTLRGCIVCGNSLLDGKETCEDGNTVNGDGCNSNCQNEACLAQTAAKKTCLTNADCGTDYTCVGMISETRFCETWKICEDANFCTVDSCNDGQDTCVHTPKNCNDSVACTIDSCNATSGACTNEVNNAACDDGNPCTDDTCNAQTGCSNIANADQCDDGVECTTGDVCVNKVCTGTPGEGCGVCGDGDVGGEEDCDDGNTTFTAGQYCKGDCTFTPCGDANGNGSIQTSDALFALRTAVGQVDCSLCVCDVTNSGNVVSSSAQRILRVAVGQIIPLNCPTGCTE